MFLSFAMKAWSIQDLPGGRYRQAGRLGEERCSHFDDLAVVGEGVGGLVAAVGVQLGVVLDDPFVLALHGFACVWRGRAGGGGRVARSARETCDVGGGGDGHGDGREVVGGEEKGGGAYQGIKLRTPSDREGAFLGAGLVHVHACLIGTTILKRPV